MPMKKGNITDIVHLGLNKCGKTQMCSVMRKRLSFNVYLDIAIY